MWNKKYIKEKNSFKESKKKSPEKLSDICMNYLSDIQEYSIFETTNCPFLHISFIYIYYYIYYYIDQRLLPPFI